MKIVVWDGTGLVMYWKRLDGGGFKWPPIVAGVMRMNIRVKGKWVYLYRAVDSTGATIDFLLSANATQQRLSVFSPRLWAERTIRRRG